MHSTAELNRDAIQALADAIDFHKNNDAFSRRIAIDAIVNDRAAYWSKVDYHQPVSCEFLDDANRIGVIKALGRVGAANRALFGDEHFLKSLIPLNEKASNELAMIREKEA